MSEPVLGLTSRISAAALALLAVLGIAGVGPGLLGIGAPGLGGRAARAEEGPPADDSRIPASVRSAVRARAETGIHTGVVVSVVDASGTSTVAYGTVDADREGPAPDESTLFEIGSITKAFTGILLADLVQQGEVALEDPIEKYLPEGVRPCVTNGRPIRLSDLATHRSGLPRMPSNFRPADPQNPYADYTVDQLYAFLGALRPSRRPEEAYEYSNLGFGLLGQLLSQATGQSYEELVAERITKPCGMQETGITLTDEQRARLARGHRGGKGVSNWDIPTLAGAGALRSSARDLVVFLQANLGLRETPLYEAMLASHRPRSSAGSSSMDVGLGWHVRRTPTRSIVWHNGGTGGYRTFLGFVAKERRGVVVLTNSTATPDDIGMHLLDSSIPLASRAPTVR